MQLSAKKSKKLVFHRSLFEEVVEITKDGVDEADKLRFQDFCFPLSHD